MSDNFRTRIRAVRFKSGGSVLVLDNPRLNNHDEMAANLRKLCEEAIGDHAGQLAGVALVCWSADGTVGATITNTSFSPYSGAAIPSIAADALRLVTTKTTIRRALGQD
jgi:hypothetical protein